MPEKLPAPRPLGAELAAESDALAHYIEVGLQGAKNTQRAYQSDLRNFEQFCAGQDLCPLPADTLTICRFITYLADAPLPKKAGAGDPQPGKTRPTRKLSTIKRHLAAIHKQHQLHGHVSAVKSEGVQLVIKGITRSKGKRQTQAPAFSLDDLRAALQALDLTTPAGLRDRALLLLGFLGAFRRSELVGVNIEHLEQTRGALLVHLQQSKTNQHGQVEDKAFFYAPDVLFCPVRAVEDWLAVLNRTEGPLFVSLKRSTSPATAVPTTKRLSTQRVNILVQRYFGPAYSAHSLRASFITVAVQKGLSHRAIKNQTKHKTDQMIDRYSRLNDVVAYNAAQSMGL